MFKKFDILDLPKNVSNAVKIDKSHRPRLIAIKFAVKAVKLDARGRHFSATSNETVFKVRILRFISDFSTLTLINQNYCLFVQKLFLRRVNFIYALKYLSYCIFHILLVLLSGNVSFQVFHYFTNLSTRFL